MISSPAIESENRRIQRVSLMLPIRVESHINENTSWNEVTRLNDVSAFGAGFNLSRPVKRGRLIQMTIPMPRKLRSYDFTESQYKVWGLVRSCITRKKQSAPDTYAVGTAFIGKHPPKNYINDPAMLFDISNRKDGNMWQIVSAPTNPNEENLPKELRRHSRYSIPANVIVEMMDDEGIILASEPTVTENLSLSGAAMFTTLQAEVGSFVRIKSEQYGVSIISIVRGRRIGQDGIPRLHVEFVDRFFPLEGIG